MNSKGFIRQKNLVLHLGFSAPTLWRKVKNGTFPKPIKLSKNITAWRIEDIELWVAEQSIETNQFIQTNG